MLDVVMPEMDGFRTCAEIRKMPSSADIPILMATGLDDFESIRRAYEAGATDFITKPINWLILKHRLRYLLRSSQAMSSLRSAEEALRKAHEDLEQRVEDRTEALKAANAKLQEEIRQRRQTEEELLGAYGDLKNTQTQLVQSAKLASIGELAAGIVHELNQPLMVIRGYAQTLMKSPVTGGDQENALKLIEKNTGRMTNIINHLRTFSRQSQSDFKPVRINTIIDDAFLMIGEQLRLRNIHFDKRLSPNLPMVCGDSNKLEQVILNLITNARDAIEQKREDKAADDSSAAPHLGSPSGKLEVITRPADNDENSIEILVKDTGCGISKEMMDKIFDPFFTTKEVGKGTGLGLSISYGIIKEHNADIDIAETGPGGTTFRIRLPIATDKNQ
jgi:C4-dicarboxylate-specific signal transduction histidine kinase